jgi:hypothetical protein
MSVNEYVIKFTQLSRYTPHEVDTNEKKHESPLVVRLLIDAPN